MLVCNVTKTFLFFFNRNFHLLTSCCSSWCICQRVYFSGTLQRGSVSTAALPVGLCPLGHTSCTSCWEASVCGSHLKLSELTYHLSFLHLLTHRWCLIARRSPAKRPLLFSCRVKCFPATSRTQHSRQWLAWLPMVPLRLCQGCMWDPWVIGKSSNTLELRSCCSQTWQSWWTKASWLTTLLGVRCTDLLFSLAKSKWVERMLGRRSQLHV